MIAQTPYQNMIYSQPQMAYTPQMYNPWTTRPQSQVQPMPVEQPQQVMQPQVKPLTGKVVQTLEAIHELCHCVCMSYNIYMPIEHEEMLCDFVATYGDQVFEIVDILTGYMGDKMYG